MSRCSRLAVFVSGNGSNLQAILDACSLGTLDAEVVVVVSSKNDIYAIERAKNAHVPVEIFDYRLFVQKSHDNDRSAYYRDIVRVLKKYYVDIVVLAGWMLIVTSDLLDAYPKKVVNIHPSLLPSFPGSHAIRDALAYGVKYTGVTVHFVDEGIDTGPIILQEPVPIYDDDNEESLASRLHVVEHKLYPRALTYLIQDRLRFDGRRVHSW